MSTLGLDRRGFPVLLSADPAPKPVVVTTASPSTRPSTVTPQEWARRQDAVREAAREFEPLSDQDVRERLRGITSRSMSSADVGQFRVDARHQHVDDLVDVLDQNERGKLRGRRTVRLQAPRGYTVRALSGLAPHEAVDVRSRLAARGWDAPQLARLDERLPRPDINAVMDPMLAQETS